jgi:hypothetical protein
MTKERRKTLTSQSKGYPQAADHVVRAIQERGVHSICFGSSSRAVVIAVVVPFDRHQFGIPI